MEFRGLRDDVYRRPLATALERLGIGPGWTCADIGAGGGDVSVALAEIVGRDGRVYAVDSDPDARDEVADAAGQAADAWWALLDEREANAPVSAELCSNH